MMINVNKYININITVAEDKCKDVGKARLLEGTSRNN